MTTHERLDAARKAYEQAGANTPIWVLNWTEEAEALIAALEAALAAQVERTATVEAALKQAELDLEARTAEKLEALEYLRQFTGAFEDSDFDSRNWANDWRERRRQAQQAAGDTEAEA